MMPSADREGKSKKRSVGRVVLRWITRSVAVVVVLFGLQITLLAFPHPFFSERAEAGAVVLYADETTDSNLEAIAAEVDRRLRVSELYDPSRSDSVFLCNSPGLYTFLARLSFVTPKAQGYNLSILGSSFVNLATVKAMGGRTGGFPKYHIREGSVEHIVAHELAHQYMAEEIGRRRFLRIPFWKQEGYPEYIANIAAIHDDDRATMQQRIKVLTDDFMWGGPAYGHARKHYRAELMVEFLIEVKGYSLADVMADDVNGEETYDEMMAWFGEQT